MKRYFGPLLALLLLFQASSFAQSNLVLRIDQSAQTIDWVDGNTITRGPEVFFDWITFGIQLGDFTTVITSPLLNYSGAGSHSQVWFQASLDHTRIVSIRLGDPVPPRPDTMYSGTAEGPATPIFSSGNFSFFARLQPGDYTLAPLGYWSGGIRVVVTDTPQPGVLHPDSSDRLPPGSNFRIVWRTQGVGAGADWKFYFETNNVQVKQLLATAVDDGQGDWHADVTLPNDLPLSCSYTLRIHDDHSGADIRSGLFCVGGE